MNNDKPYCILFAGPVGCSKTPVAHFLSCNLGLPIFNNDAIRTEVQEDTLTFDFDRELHLQRRDERLQQIIGSKRSFIMDVSIDRVWPELKEKLEKQGYRWFIISFDISLGFLEKLYKVKKYEDSLKQVEKWHNDHKVFIEKYGSEVDFTIDNTIFSQRLEKSLEASKKFLQIGWAK